MIRLKRLTKTADQNFKNICENWNPDAPENILDIQDFPAKDLSAYIQIDENKRFNNKFELGKYLYETLKGIDIDARSWHFIVIVYHQQLLRKDRKIGAVDRFYISYCPYAHLLKSTFDLYNTYHDNAELIEFLLQGPVNTANILFTETVKRPDMMKNEQFIRVCRKLFYKENEKKIKRGISSSIIRLIDVFKQYERTFDLYSMPAKIILQRLISKHKEFDVFRKGKDY